MKKKDSLAIISLEQRFYEVNGVLYTNGAFPREFWQRYLDVFDRVLIVARVKKESVVLESWKQVSCENIDFYPLPYYIGLRQGLTSLLDTRRALKRLVNNFHGSYILRVGSPIADSLSSLLIRKGIEYAVEVVGDPWDVFAPGAISHPLRPFLRLYFAIMLRRQCRLASFSSYVTEFALQNRYPPKNSKVTEHASSISLSEEFFYTKRDYKNRAPNWIFVGTLEQMQKAPDILIKAFSLVLKKNPKAKLTVVGDGREKERLMNLAKTLGAQDAVDFVGHLASSELVREKLLENDYFALPSRGEGLPRAMIEAMACGCLCVGSNIGGIRELIDHDWIAKVNDPQDLAQKMLSIMKLSSEEAQTLALKNNEQAKKYLKKKLDRRRFDFYTKVKGASAKCDVGENG